ncbi:hypothetical protein [Methanobrevibacter gottschalkii]|uniref:hypothetical protein n=1 Tax=Methanobrevibacter gottschalkii TaxID=190974 RepID=UPI0009F6576B|nr:hypothetical protein [Methanobrevibacter gottschalkii]
MKTNELLKNIFMIYNNSEGTKKAYAYVFKQYCQYFGMELHEFLRKRKMKKTRKSNGSTEKSKADCWNSTNII